MSKISAASMLAVSTVAAKLRNRAATLRPDEDLATSIAINGAIGDEFAVVYQQLRDEGLSDKALDRFGLENATAAEIRDAADLLENLARSEPAPKKNMRRRGNKSQERLSHWVNGIAMLVIGLPAIFGSVLFLRLGLSVLEERRLDAAATRAAAMRPVTAHVPSPPLEETAEPPAPQLAPIAEGFEKTASNLIVPARPRDFVTDRAGVLTGDSARALNGRLIQFEHETSNQLLVFIDHRLPADTTLEELGSASIRQWGVGQKGKDNGVIFFVFVDDRKMRIEVGYGLESVLTDAKSKGITSQIVKPLFQQGKIAEGIEAGVQAIIDATRGAESGGAVTSVAPSVQSLKPIIILFSLCLACFSLFLYVVWCYVQFVRGRRNRLFSTALSSSRSYSGSAWSLSGSDSSGSGSDSGGSFSGGGGDGGGGGASDSW